MNRKQIIILASILLILLLPIAEAKLLKVFSWGGAKLKGGRVTGKFLGATGMGIVTGVAGNCNDPDVSKNYDLRITAPPSLTKITRPDLFVMSTTAHSNPSVSSIPNTHIDFCELGLNVLREGICTSSGGIDTQDVQCPNGCQNGACLQPPPTPPPAPTPVQPPVAPPVPTPAPQPVISQACIDAENRLAEAETQLAAKEQETESKEQERDSKKEECERIEDTNPCRSLKGQQKNECKERFDKDKRACRNVARQLQEQFSALNKEKQALQEQLSRVQAQREKACQPSRPLPDLAIDTTKTGFYNKKINEFIYDTDNPLSFSDNVVEGQRLKAAVKFVNVGADTPLHLVSTEVIFKKDGSAFFRSRVDTPSGATQNSFSRPYNVYIDTNAQTAEEVKTIKLTPAGRYCLDINVDFNSLLAEKPEGEGPANKFTDVGCINVVQPTSTPPLGAVVTRVTPTGRTVKSFRIVG